LVEGFCPERVGKGARELRRWISSQIDEGERERASPRVVTLPRAP